MNFLNFFVPDLSEPLQVIFFGLISCLLLTTLFFLKLNAKSENWEKNWNGSFGPSDSLLSADQGTLHDIGDAVATKSEQTSDVMPGFLLIIGLLGTFLGLGIALNQASEIISNDLSGQNYDDMMNSLMQMMAGLGTKFKASIWGISGFIVLRVLSGLMGTEKKRLNWCASKIKKDHSVKSEQRIEGESLRLNKTLNASEQLGETINLALNSGFEKQNQMMQASYDLFSQISNQNKELKNEIAKTNIVLSSSLGELTKSNKSMELVIASLHENNAENKKLNEGTVRVESKLIDMLVVFEGVQANSLDIGKSVNANASNVYQQLETIAQNITDLSATNKDSIREVQKDVIGGMTDLEKCMDTVGRESAQLLEKIVEVVELSDSNTQDNLAGIRKDFASVALATKESSRQMKEFSQSTKSSLTTLGSSSERMHEASVGIQSGAAKLSSTVGTFETKMNKVMNKVSTDLDGTITKMSTTFTNSMSGMATNMSRSTGDISKAVKDNAKSVEVTMATVKSSISESLKIQQKSSNEFQLSSQTLNETMEEVTTLVNDLTESIQSGLSAVSRSGKEVKSLNAAYKAISDTVINAAKENESICLELKNVSSEIQKSNIKTLDLNSSLDRSNNQSINKLTKLVELLSQSNANNSELNELKQVTKILNEHYSFMQQYSEQQPARMSEAFTTASEWGKISTDITANNRELKALNSSLSHISDKVAELSKVQRNIDAVAL